MVLGMVLAVDEDVGFVVAADLTWSLAALSSALVRAKTEGSFGGACLAYFWVFGSLGVWAFGRLARDKRKGRSGHGQR